MIESGQTPTADVATRDLTHVVRITSATFLVTLLLSWRLYIHDLRIFALSPVVETLALTPSHVEWALLVVGAGCLSWLLLRPTSRLSVVGVLVCTAFWILQDLMRLQPYLYMYCITLLFAALRGPDAGPVLNALRIMVCSVYFWAGFHKLNATFVLATFPWFIEPFYKPAVIPTLADTLVRAAGYAVPIFELAIGILLLFPRQRRLATLMAFVMLLVVLLCLGPLGRDWNVIVWPWNVYLFLLEVILFYNPAVRPETVLMRLDLPGTLSLVWFSIAPAFAAFGLLHSYPGFKLYSGNTDAAAVVFAADEQFSKMPEKLKKLVIADGTLPLADWTERELNTIVYPEPVVFRRGAKGLCPYLEHPDEALLRIYAAPVFDSVAQDYVDVPLCAENY